MRNYIFLLLMFLLVAGCSLFTWDVVSAETTSTPTVSNNRFCDLDKAAGSGITITNTSSTATSTAFMTFFNEAHGFQNVNSDSLAPGQAITYQPLPAFLSASYKGWAVLTDSLGQFSAEAHAPGVMHSADFDIAIPSNLNLVFLTPQVIGDNCYNKFAVDWGDGSALEVADKGDGPLFHGYDNTTMSYTVTLTTRLNSSDIISHSEQVDIVIASPTAVALGQVEVGATPFQWPLLLLIAMLTLHRIGKNQGSQHTL